MREGHKLHKSKMRETTEIESRSCVHQTTDHQNQQCMYQNACVCMHVCAYDCMCADDAGRLVVVCGLRGHRVVFHLCCF